MVSLTDMAENLQKKPTSGLVTGSDIVGEVRIPAAMVTFLADIPTDGVPVGREALDKWANGSRQPWLRAAFREAWFKDERLSGRFVQKIGPRYYRTQAAEKTDYYHPAYNGSS